MKKTILVIDDNAEMRRMLVLLLEAQGFVAFTAPDGAAALAIATQVRPHLIITDIDMPKITGSEMIKMLRAQELYRSVPIIVLSSNVDLEGAQTSGADAVLTKPLGLSDLVTRIKALLSD
jgi:DNA-binding response OmpR family regulator